MNKGDHNFSSGGYTLKDKTKTITTPIPMMPQFKHKTGKWKGNAAQAKAREAAGFDDRPRATHKPRTIAEAQAIQDRLDRL